jgi:hypothetical protein
MVLEVTLMETTEHVWEHKMCYIQSDKCQRSWKHAEHAERMISNLSPMTGCHLGRSRER